MISLEPQMITEEIPFFRSKDRLMCAVKPIVSVFNVMIKALPHASANDTLKGPKQSLTRETGYPNGLTTIAGSSIFFFAVLDSFVKEPCIKFLTSCRVQRNDTYLAGNEHKDASCVNSTKTATSLANSIPDRSSPEFTHP
jgi:hypothetical protein